MNETTAQEALPDDHPLMKAWNKFTATDEFKNALHWSVATRYGDGRPISDVSREQHAKGGMWLAFTAGLCWDEARTDDERTQRLLHDIEENHAQVVKANRRDEKGRLVKIVLGAMLILAALVGAWYAVFGGGR